VIRALLLGALLLQPLAEAQTTKVWRIAYLSGASAEIDQRRLEAFRDGLRELGYAEGRNVVIVERYADGRPEKLPALAKELVSLRSDVFVVYGAASAVPAVQQATRTAPIVFTVSADPVAERIVSSLARPGGQVTGFSDLHSALVTKRLELLKELLPSASRIAVLGSGASTVNRLQLKEIEAAAPAFGVSVLALAVRDADDIERVFRQIGEKQPAGLMVLGDFLLATHRKQILRLATAARLPTIFTTREAAEAGALMSHGTHFPELWRRSAHYVDKIFKGAKPGDLPIEQPTRFETVVNLNTARAIGVTLPRAILLRADQVIE
jgi:putative ABC transport system substrate-binding protein